jgi:tetratricopeptide (TPR) repeat protein
LISILAAATLAAAPAPCPDVITAEAFICRAIHATADRKPDEAAQAFEQAAQQLSASDPQVARLYAAAGNSWIEANQPGKAALDLDKALAGTGLQAEQRGEALLDRARAAEAQGDLKTARAKLTEAKQTISGDPFLWFFSAALAIREGDVATARASIGQALTISPADPMILFEAGHVAQFAGDNVGARDYWNRVIERDPNGQAGNAARDALKLLPVPITVQPEPKAPK